jgi:RNA polymerase sigma-70 factor (ECF subfamily)
MELQSSDNECVDTHLSQISTAWSLVDQAHVTSPEARQVAQAALFQRYRRAVYHYLLAALRDQHAADEVFQEFSLKFVRGDFRGADPQRGRFRNFLKTSLSHLIANRRRQRPLVTVPEPPEEAAGFNPRDLDFAEHWRSELLERAWEALDDAQQLGGPPFYTVLRRHAEDPKLTSTALAAQVSAELKLSPLLTDVATRKLLQRAREQFADLLVEEVARSLSSGNHAELEQELCDLGFYGCCRRSLQRRKGEQVT